jgi:hypothetical protein
MSKQTTKKIEKIDRKTIWPNFPYYVEDILYKILDKQDEIIDHINKEGKHE